MSHPILRTRRPQSGRVSSGPVFTAFALIALFFLFTEHRAHLFGWLPFLLLLACPLLHMFHGHGGHGGHGRPGDDAGPPSDGSRTPSMGAGNAPPAEGGQHRH